MSETSPASPAAAASNERVRLTIDGREIEVPVGTTIWEAARALGIHIPALCHDPRFRPVGVCRLCVVDVGGRVLAASCVRPAEAGMKVTATSPALDQHRKVLTALLMSDQPDEPAAPRPEGSQLRALADR
ncbi:MAG: (2Fe-2S)-binding protein, partial [Myxococcales bacterium]|nr:(2Fe-2S)-binding protein [Myxococcales bacterium]